MLVVAARPTGLDLDAIVAAVAATLGPGQDPNAYPVQGGTYRAYLDLPDPSDGRGVQDDLADSSKMISIRYGSPQATTELVTWLLQRFPPAPTTSPCNRSNRTPTLIPASSRRPSRTRSPSASDIRPSLHHPSYRSVHVLAGGRRRDRTRRDPAISRGLPR
jgi:hypothetical protein